MIKLFVNIIEDLISYVTNIPSQPPPNIANATVHFADIAQQNPCDPRAIGLTPCIRKCEHACQVTFQFDDPKCSEGYSSAIWSDTCYKNFRNGKFRRKFETKGCTDYEIWWGTHPMPHGSGWARDITLEKKV
ncbi:uncharacterized protein FIESC28_06213 [Fusarium coffeatum]|uniref:Uncharacterized protein n=1 Tax=Fusarium coffeatum TaxID=231269 RepID=A0A366RM02_9HYPO|nr:uncharacterized protein FIESC28_06213 [Fusarium coffeatum]RBR18147.1 hypothetical protein FIESC28_06213 [Fusarium coffeatum]